MNKKKIFSGMIIGYRNGSFRTVCEDGSIRGGNGGLVGDLKEYDDKLMFKNGCNPTSAYDIMRYGWLAKNGSIAWLETRPKELTLKEKILEKYGVEYCTQEWENTDEDGTTRYGPGFVLEDVVFVHSSTNTETFDIYYDRDHHFLHARVVAKGINILQGIKELKNEKH